MGVIDSIRARTQEWAEVVGDSGDDLIVRARPKIFGAPLSNVVELRIWGDNQNVKVSEREIGTHYPNSCPERHINPTGTFCLGLNAGDNVKSDAHAEKWWNDLSEYLGCQDYASNHRRWPPNKGLSHGDAAKAQLIAERVAKELDWLQDYRDAVDFGVGWLAGPLPKVNRESDRLLNGRAVCPKGCEHPRKQDPLLRRECDQRAKIAQLVRAEHLRRKAERAFVESFIKDGFVCCGTMDKCPFKERS